MSNKQLVECTIRVDDGTAETYIRYVWRDLKSFTFDKAVGITIATCLKKMDFEGDAIIMLAQAVTDFDDWPEPTAAIMEFVAAAWAVLNEDEPDESDEPEKLPLDTPGQGR
jgi:hypothetical protein